MGPFFCLELSQPRTLYKALACFIVRFLTRPYKQYQLKERAIGDPTTLILVDEADRLHINSLEQIRSIFDEGKAGLVLIGMPGIEKRIARFPQFYSRIGFVDAFRHP